MGVIPFCSSPRKLNKELCRTASMGVVSVEVPPSFNCRSLSVGDVCFEFPCCVGSVRELHVPRSLLCGV